MGGRRNPDRALADLIGHFGDNVIGTRQIGRCNAKIGENLDCIQLNTKRTDVGRYLFGPAGNQSETGKQSAERGWQLCTGSGISGVQEDTRDAVVLDVYYKTWPKIAFNEDCGTQLPSIQKT